MIIPTVHGLEALHVEQKVLVKKIPKIFSPACNQQNAIFLYGNWHT